VAIDRVRILATVAALMAPASLWAGPVSGLVRTSTQPGIAPAPAVVYAEPIDKAPGTRAASVTLTQKNKTFTPRVVAVPVGSTVEFPNNDPIFHNVFSLSGPQPFDLGLYRSGQSRARRFTAPGTYRVFCNIHPQMSALVVVVPTPHVTVTDPDGRYVLDLPPGRYRITAVSERSDPVAMELESSAGATAAPDLTLDESSWILVQHKNKFGADYPASAYRQ